MKALAAKSALAESWYELSALVFAAALFALLVGPNVELHHSTMHVKPPETGHPFPMHQDIPFYPHEDGRYIDALVHMDNADEQSGCIKFLAGSHKLGKLEHITGPDIEPYLPTDRYRLEDAVSVPAKPGDVVVFHLWTVHGSAVNQSGRWRRLVRVGFRDPRNRRQLRLRLPGKPMFDVTKHVGQRAIEIAEEKITNGDGMDHYFARRRQFRALLRRAAGDERGPFHQIVEPVVRARDEPLGEDHQRTMG